MDATERNEFIREHYELFEKMCRSSAAKVLRKYSNVSREDLIGYAMLGVVEAVERADIHNRCWQAYVYLCCGGSQGDAGYQTRAFTKCASNQRL